MQPIETARLLIRPLVLEDWPAVYAYASDADVMTYIPTGVLTEAQTQAFVEENSGMLAQSLAVVLKEQNRLIGHMDFHPWFAYQTYEIGWAFHRAMHGRGYATEAARALLHYSFEILHLHRVIATCQPENPASYRVMEKLGMRREGYFRQCIYRGEDQWWDEYFYAILASEWVAQMAKHSVR